MRLRFGFQQARDRAGAPVPVRSRRLELSASRTRQRVDPGAARVFGLPPLGVDEPAAFEALQRRQQRTGIDLEDAARHLLDATRDPEAVHRLEAERLEDEQVERALNDVGVRVAHAATLMPLILDVKM